MNRMVLFRGAEDVVRSNATVRGEPVTCDTLEGRTLMKLLPPSANVINFRIAHEVAHLIHHDWIWSALLAPVMLITGYHLAVYLCKCKLFLLHVVIFWN